MKQQRIVITGGPSTGKTTLINFLKKEGYFCFNEISREIIQKYQAKGIPQPFLSHPKEFNEQLLQGRNQQFEDATTINHTPLFYDRSILDILAYINYAEEQIPLNFIDSAQKNNYDLVFITPPWKAIYTKDAERFESFSEALKIHEALLNTYHDFGYTLIEVPIGTLEDRASFIINFIK